MLNRIMERLGWVPKGDFEEYMHWHDEVVRMNEAEIEKLNTTVQRLSALVPVSKKRGRPRKYAKAE